MIAQLRTHLDRAIEFAHICRQVAPELAEDSRQLIDGERDLYRTAVRQLLRHSVGD